MGFTKRSSVGTRLGSLLLRLSFCLLVLPCGPARAQSISLTPLTQTVTQAVKVSPDLLQLVGGALSGARVKVVVQASGPISRVSNGPYLGVAPGAHLINLRVLNSRGTGTASGLLAALDRVAKNRAAYNVRVVNLSLGTTAAVGVAGDGVRAGDTLLRGDDTPGMAAQPDTGTE